MGAEDRAEDHVVWEAVCYQAEFGPQRLFLASSSRWGWVSLRTLYPFPSRTPLEGIIQRPFVVVLCGDTALHKACQVESTHNTGRSQENKPERHTSSTHGVIEIRQGQPQGAAQEQHRDSKIVATFRVCVSRIV